MSPVNARIRMSRASRSPARGLAIVAAIVLTAIPVTRLSGKVQADPPIDGGDLAIVPLVIDAGPGNQTDPHVDGNLVSYTTNESGRLRIGYYDFASDTRALVPIPDEAVDQLSDVSAGRIAFSRSEPSGRVPVLVYDVAAGTTTEIQPALAYPYRLGVAIGGPVVAIVDLALSAIGDLFVAELGGSVHRLTADARIDRRPSVSPAGDFVAWESCESGLKCAVRMAWRSGSGWITGLLPEIDATWGNPDTDGIWVVFDWLQSGEQDIFLLPIADGAETMLRLPGVQRNPSVRAGVVAFESIAPGATMADLYVYSIASNTYYRVTSTDSLDERLSDIAVLPDGQVRLVWAVADSSGASDVMGTTFTLPTGPVFSFGGLLQPVDPWPVVNVMKAGGAVPVRFSLGGPHGLDIFAAGYPRSEEVACDSSAEVDGVETTVAAGGSGLTYDATTDSYSYVWKSERAWAGTCRQLVLRFTDGTTVRAAFQFK